MRMRGGSSWFARVALVVLLLSALGPTISRAIAASSLDPARFASLCSAGETDPSKGNDAAGIDCPLCVVQTHSVTLAEGLSRSSLDRFLLAVAGPVRSAARGWAVHDAAMRGLALARAPPPL